MGVHGLWRLLDSFGTVVQPEQWRGKRVAIDASIWIVQFRSQVKDREDVNQRVLEGFLLRILKLLFYGIEPVFVFDGPATALKAQEKHRRQQLRVAAAQVLLRRRAKAIVAAQVSSGTLNVAALPTAPLEEESLNIKMNHQDANSGDDSKTISPPSLRAIVETDKQLNSEKRHKHQSHSHHRRRRDVLRKIKAPAEVSANVTSTFLVNAQEVLDERARGERVVAENALRFTSRSLFMGPRRAVEESGKPTGCGLQKQQRRQASKRARSETMVVDDEGFSPTEAIEVNSSSDDDSAVVEEELSARDTSRIYKNSRIAPAPASAAVALYDCDWERSDEVSLSTSSSVEYSKDENTSEDGSVIEVSSEGSEVDWTSPDEWADTSASSEKEGGGSGENTGDTGGNSDPESGSENDDDGSDDDDDDTEEEALLWNPGTQLTPWLPSHVDAHERQLAEGENSRSSEFTPVRSQEYARLAVHGQTMTSTTNDAVTSTVAAAAAAPTLAVTPAAAATANNADPKSFHQAEQQQATASTTTGLFTASAPPRRDASKTVHVLPFDLLDIVELLDCCGVPFVLSPAEADAQCAFLSRAGLVDAVFTEDSDVVVHGAAVVLRGFFASGREVVAYKRSDLHMCGLDKRVLVALALLLGCDYTEGVCGLGLTSALDAIASSWIQKKKEKESGGEKENEEDTAHDARVVHRVLERWASLARAPPASIADADDDLSLLQFDIVQQSAAHWRSLGVPEQFPAGEPIEAFFYPLIDRDTASFACAGPDWVRLRAFAALRGLLGSSWMVQRFELAQRTHQAHCEKLKAAEGGQQRSLMHYGVSTCAREQFVFKKQPSKQSSALGRLRACRKQRVM